MIKLMKIVEKSTEKTDETIENKYYSPVLFKLIHDQLYLIPLWTGIMIEYSKEIHHNRLTYISSRLSNNFVENYFGQVKNKILNGKKSSFITSELTTKFYRNIKATYLELYETQENFKNNSTINKKRISEISEIWKDKKKMKNNKNF